MVRKGTRHPGMNQLNMMHIQSITSLLEVQIRGRFFSLFSRGASFAASDLNSSASPRPPLVSTPRKTETSHGSPRQWQAAYLSTSHDVDALKPWNADARYLGDVTSSKVFQKRSVFPARPRVKLAVTGLESFILSLNSHLAHVFPEYLFQFNET